MIGLEKKLVDTGVFLIPFLQLILRRRFFIFAFYTSEFIDAKLGSLPKNNSRDRHSAKEEWTGITLKKKVHKFISHGRYF